MPCVNIVTQSWGHLKHSCWAPSKKARETLWNDPIVRAGLEASFIYYWIRNDNYFAAFLKGISKSIVDLHAQRATWEWLLKTKPRVRAAGGDCTLPLG
jgi:hypothetical protein